MICKKVSKIVFAFLLVFMVAVAPVLAADASDDEEGSHVKLIPANEDNDNNRVSSRDDNRGSDDDDVSGFDKVNSDDYIFGFKKNNNYDVTRDLNGQEAVDSASSLPIFPICIAFILLLAVGVVLEYLGVTLWNQHKVSTSARDENPIRAAEGIKTTKNIQKEYSWSFVLTFGFIGVILWVIFTFFL